MVVSGKVGSDFFRYLPKIELHRHLVGSIRVKTFLDIAVKNNLILPTYDLERLKNLIEIESASDLRRFLSPLKILRLCFCNKKAIERVAYEAVEDAAKENVKYLELIIGPAFEASFHHLSLEEVFEGVILGVKKAEEKYDVKVNLIAGPTFKWKERMAHSPSEVLEASLRYKEKVVGFGLPAETKEGIPFSRWQEELKQEYMLLADRAKEHGLFLTVHAGEVGVAQSIIDAIKYLKTDRIAHGIKSIENLNILKRLVKKKIPLEICISSNIKSGVVSLREHPIRQLWKHGALITINTDDPTLCKTTLTKEYKILKRNFNFSYSELKQLILNALASSFLNQKEKERLNQKLSKCFAELEKH